MLYYNNTVVEHRALTVKELYAYTAFSVCSSFLASSFIYSLSHILTTIYQPLIRSSLQLKFCIPI